MRAVRILVSNDDGIFSPGLQALAEVASEFAEVRIVAPDVEQSSMSHAITGTRPLSYRKTKIAAFEAYRVNGTPADCVALGISQLGPVDRVLSGVNLGHNIGHAIWHSGTVAAAKQAALLGVPAIAFSAPPWEEPMDFGPIKAGVNATLKSVLAGPPHPLLNVNFPAVPRGVRWTRQSFRHYDGRMVPGEDPSGHRHFWFTVVPIEQVEEGTDRWAVNQGYVSITPLRLDLTDERALQAAQRDSRPPA